MFGEFGSVLDFLQCRLKEAGAISDGSLSHLLLKAPEERRIIRARFAQLLEAAWRHARSAQFTERRSGSASEAGKACDLSEVL